MGDVLQVASRLSSYSSRNYWRTLTQVDPTGLTRPSAEPGATLTSAGEPSVEKGYLTGVKSTRRKAGGGGIPFPLHRAYIPKSLCDPTLCLHNLHLLPTKRFIIHLFNEKKYICNCNALQRHLAVKNLLSAGE